MPASDEGSDPFASERWSSGPSSAGDATSQAGQGPRRLPTAGGPRAARRPRVPWFDWSARSGSGEDRSDGEAIGRHREALDRLGRVGERQGLDVAVRRPHEVDVVRQPLAAGHRALEESAVRGRSVQARLEERADRGPGDILLRGRVEERREVQLGTAGRAPVAAAPDGAELAVVGAVGPERGLEVVAGDRRAGVLLDPDPAADVGVVTALELEQVDVLEHHRAGVLAVARGDPDDRPHLQAERPRLRARRSATSERAASMAATLAASPPREWPISATRVMSTMPWNGLAGCVVPGPPLVEVQQQEPGSRPLAPSPASRRPTNRSGSPRRPRP